MDLSDLIDRNAAFAPDKAAIRFAGLELSYAGLAQRIEEAARGLKSQLGVGRGDRVAVLAANHPDTLVLLYACARLGALMVPLNWRLAVPEQVYILCDASVKVLVVEQAFAPIIEPLAKALRTCGGQAMLKSLALERIYRDSRCGSLMLPWTAEICLDRLGRETLYEPGEKDE